MLLIFRPSLAILVRKYLVSKRQCLKAFNFNLFKIISVKNCNGLLLDSKTRVSTRIKNSGKNIFKVPENAYDSISNFLKHFSTNFLKFKVLLHKMAVNWCKKNWKLTFVFICQYSGYWQFIWNVRAHAQSRDLLFWVLFGLVFRPIYTNIFYFNSLAQLVP